MEGWWRCRWSGEDGCERWPRREIRAAKGGVVVVAGGGANSAEGGGVVRQK